MVYFCVPDHVGVVQGVSTGVAAISVADNGQYFVRTNFLCDIHL